MKLSEGCKGCNKYWYDHDLAKTCPADMRGTEGECSRCHRCLSCCGDEKVQFSCAWRIKGRVLNSRQLAAQKRYESNRLVLSGYRNN